MNKFEQVSSDYHHMSLVGGGYPREGWVSQRVDGYPTYPMMRVMYLPPHPPPNKLTDTCENITFP